MAIYVVSYKEYLRVQSFNSVGLLLADLLVGAELGVAPGRQFIIKISAKAGKKGLKNQKNWRCTASNTADVFTVKKKDSSARNHLDIKIHVQ